jgi:hypothetical protein
MIDELDDDLMQKVLSYNSDQGIEIALGEVNGALSALVLVLKIHKAEEFDNHDGTTEILCLGCGCKFVWPCPTIQAIRRELW